jgi:hypothetical protein
VKNERIELDDIKMDEKKISCLPGGLAVMILLIVLTIGVLLARLQ